MNRRTFLHTASVLTASLTPAARAVAALESQPSLPVASAEHLPRWRGFNLLEKYTVRRGGNPPFQESDFSLLAEWGFNFVRLPLSYRCWTDPDNWLQLREDQLKDIDGVVEFGRQHGVHVNLNLHRAPGYCVNPPKEPLSLWEDEKALDACAFHWAHFAKRYKGIPNERLSFDLLNEPSDIPEATYVRVVKRLVSAIHAEDPQRLIIADGLRWGRDPVQGLVDLGIAQSTRGYDPMEVSHYQANWVHGADKWPEPTWPLKRGNRETNKDTLFKDRIRPWKQMEEKKVGVHVGEWGAHNKTPHPVVLAWMRDCLALWKEAGWGWSLWNLHGSFGVMDSQRADVKYESFRGHQLDREMLEVLRAG